MKDIIKIFLIALPFSSLASYGLNFINQLGLGVWLVESLSIRGFWPVSIAFYVEDIISALITVIPYVGLIYYFVRNKKLLTITTAIIAYILFTFLFLYQKESLTGSFFTLMQSENIAVYVAIIPIFILVDSIFNNKDIA